MMKKIIFLLILCVCLIEANAQKKSEAMRFSKADLKRDSTNVLKLPDEVISYECTFLLKGTVITESVIGYRLSRNMYDFIKRMKKGEYFDIETIRAKNQTTGAIYKLPGRRYILID